MGYDDSAGDRDEAYGLSWVGKREAIEASSASSTHVLAADDARWIGGPDADNVFIEGDNLEALRLLRPDYAGAVRLVYIDPPYNTAKPFVYNDDYSGPDGHSAWLSMMYPRLVLARELLAADGVLMAHIDEHEGPRLFLLLEEVFGAENHLGDIVWDKRNPKGDTGGVSSQHELILVFARSRETLLSGPGLQRKKNSAEAILAMAERIWGSVGRRQLPEDVRVALARHKIPEHALAGYEKDVTPDVARRQFARWLRAQPFSGGELAYDKLDDDGDVYRLVSMAWPNKKRPPDDYFVPLVHPVTGLPCAVPARGWRNSPSTMADLLARGEIVFGADETTQPQRKYLLKENMTTNVASVIPYGGSDDRLMDALGIPFDTVKPVELVRPLVASCTAADDVVLDFFAGSATVAHAVAVQNDLDGGRRRCISVDVPEPTRRSSSARRAGFAHVSDLTYARLVAITEQLPAAREQGLRVYVLVDSRAGEAG